MTMLTQRFDAICERLALAASRAGRNPKEVQLVAVSKWHGADKVAALAMHWAEHATGTPPVFGESYMQEAREKQPQVEAMLADKVLAVPVRWHFIGHVQSRKAKDVIGRFCLIHSVGSLKLAQSLQKTWENHVAGAPVGLDAPAPAPQDILIQVNVGREPQKSGVAPDDLEELVSAIAAMPQLRLRGLMCIPPAVENMEESRPFFTLLRQLRDTMQDCCGLALPELSMGMSSDFEAAVEEGATLVRIGTDIFGRRM